MKKFLSLLAACFVGTSFVTGVVACIGNNNSNSVIDKIKNTSIKVPYDTNINTTNTGTIKTLKTSLQQANPGLTTADLSYLFFNGVQLNGGAAVTMQVIYYHDGTTASKKIMVTKAKYTNQELATALQTGASAKNPYHVATSTRNPKSSNLSWNFSSNRSMVASLVRHIPSLSQADTKSLQFTSPSPIELEAPLPNTTNNVTIKSTTDKGWSVKVPVIYWHSDKVVDNLIDSGGLYILPHIARSPKPPTLLDFKEDLIYAALHKLDPKTPPSYQSLSSVLQNRITFSSFPGTFDPDATVYNCEYQIQSDNNVKSTPQPISFLEQSSEADFTGKTPIIPSELFSKTITIPYNTVLQKASTLTEYGEIKISDPQTQVAIVNALLSQYSPQQSKNSQRLNNLFFLAKMISFFDPKETTFDPYNSSALPFSIKLGVGASAKVISGITLNFKVSQPTPGQLNDLINNTNLSITYQGSTNPQDQKNITAILNSLHVKNPRLSKNDIKKITVTSKTTLQRGQETGETLTIQDSEGKPQFQVPISVYCS